MTCVLLVDKSGTIKPLKIKEFCEEEFYKKCGYKSQTNFKKQHTWKTKIEGTTYYISLFAKTDSRTAMGENKYEFPPPVDNVLYFGTCLLAGYKNETQPINLTVEIWNSVYNKLYGGFENLDDTLERDELETDELATIPQKKKTKEGYLMDGFVVEDKVKKVSSKKHTSTTSSVVTSTTQNINNLPISSSDSGKIKEKHSTIVLSDEEDNISEDIEEDEDEASVYTDVDIDEDDYEDSSSSKKRNKKKKGNSNTSSKKKDSSQKEHEPSSLDITVAEFIITDELEEEPYI